MYTVNRLGSLSIILCLHPSEYVVPPTSNSIPLVLLANHSSQTPSLFLSSVQSMLFVTSTVVPDPDAAGSTMFAVMLP